jgi:hypothetical protein
VAQRHDRVQGHSQGIAAHEGVAFQVRRQAPGLRTPQRHCLPACLPGWVGVQQRHPELLLLAADIRRRRPRRRDVWPSLLFMGFMLPSFIFGTIHLFKSGVIDTPLAISLIYMLYNMIPQCLLLLVSVQSVQQQPAGRRHASRSAKGACLEISVRPAGC